LKFDMQFEVDFLLLKRTYPLYELLNHSSFHCFNIEREGTPAKRFGKTLA